MIKTDLKNSYLKEKKIETKKTKVGIDEQDIQLCATRRQTRASPGRA